MIRWLSKYVQRIDLTVGVVSVGIGIREPMEPQQLISQSTQPPFTSQSPVETGAKALESPSTFVIRVVTGHAPSGHDIPRDLDLTLEGDEIQMNIHKPDRKPKMRFWVHRQKLRDVLNHWKECGRSTEPVVMLGRTVRKPAKIELVFQHSGEVQVRADWWVSVPIEDFRIALNEFDVSM